MKSPFILLLLSFAMLSACQTKTKPQPMKKYEWLPYCSAPLLHPNEIINGHLYLEDGDQVYIPSSGINRMVWGKEGSLHTQGEDFKAIPVKLEIIWASYLENKYYGGSWDLPVEKIRALFEQGIQDWSTKKQITFSGVVVGCAPGGVVVVWVQSYNNQVEVARFQATETQVDIRKFVPGNPTITQKEYFDVSQSEPEAYENLKDKGLQLELWDLYRKKYNWRTGIEIANYQSERYALEMFNGETEDIFGAPLTKNEFKQRAIPRTLYFLIKDKTGKRTVFNFESLNEKELFGLFAQIDPSKPLEVILRMNEDLTNRKLVLKQEDKEFLIKKVDFENTWEYKD